MSKGLHETLAASLADQQYGFRLMRREAVVQPMFQHIWQGWGYRLRHGSTLGALLYPTTTRYENVPRGVTRTVTGKLKGRTVDFGIIDFGKQEEPGTYERMQATTRDGELLFEMPLIRPLTAQVGESVTITNATISLT